MAGKNFEKDINVPSKEIIIDGCDVSECPYYCGHDICKNTCHYFSTPCEWVEIQNCMYKYGKRKEQEAIKRSKELIRIRKERQEGQKMNRNLHNQLDQLKAELKSAKELREYTYDCCKRAGEELAKNSFEWDGKEKNLVVQAMELNERYDQLKVELEAYKMEAEEGKEINAELKAENEELKKFHINLVGVKECEITELAELKKENQKFEYQIEKERKENLDLRGQLGDAECLLCRYDRTLSEIKEIVQFGFRPYKVCGEHNNYCDVLNEILNIISEVEDV